MSKRAKATLSITLQNNDVLQVYMASADGSIVRRTKTSWSEVLQLLPHVKPVCEKRRDQQGKVISQEYSAAFEKYSRHFEGRLLRLERLLNEPQTPTD